MDNGVKRGVREGDSCIISVRGAIRHHRHWRNHSFSRPGVKSVRFSSVISVRFGLEFSILMGTSA